MAGVLPPQNRVLREFLQRGVRDEHPRSSQTAELYEFDDCRYKLVRLKDAPDVLAASFVHPFPLAPAAEPALREEYVGIAELAEDPEPGYQVTLNVSAQALRGLPEPQRTAMLDKLAAVRLYIVGAQLQELLKALAAGELADAASQAVLARPGMPFFVRAEVEALTALFPIRLGEGHEGALAAAFVQAWKQTWRHAFLRHSVALLSKTLSTCYLARAARTYGFDKNFKSRVRGMLMGVGPAAQEFAEARRAASCGDAPRCVYTHPGQPPPCPLSGAAGEACASGGYLALVIQPRHVATPARVDAVAWALLSLYSHIDVHIKRFKGFMHSQLRQRTDAMLAALERAAFAEREQKPRKTATGRTFAEQAVRGEAAAAALGQHAAAQG